MKHQSILLRALCTTFVAIAMLWAAPSAVGDDAVLEIEGTCPGTVRIAWSNALPDRHLGVVFGLQEGMVTLPVNFPCGSTVIGVSGYPREVARLRSGPDGAGWAVGRASRGFCGGYVQILVFDTPRCQVSNVVQVPE